MDPDAVKDLANRGLESTLGRPVTYTPTGGAAVSALPDGTPLRGHFMAKWSNLNQSVEGFDNADPAMLFRTLSLSAAGITPRASETDRVTFEVNGESRTYRVTDVKRTDHGGTVCFLGART